MLRTQLRLRPKPRFPGRNVKFPANGQPCETGSLGGFQRFPELFAGDPAVYCLVCERFAARVVLVHNIDIGPLEICAAMKPKSQPFPKDCWALRDAAPIRLSWPPVRIQTSSPGLPVHLPNSSHAPDRDNPGVAQLQRRFSVPKFEIRHINMRFLPKALMPEPVHIPRNYILAARSTPFRPLMGSASKTGWITCVGVTKFIL